MNSKIALALFGILALAVLAASIPAEQPKQRAFSTACGRSKYYGQKIVGGVESEPNAWPWQVWLTFSSGGSGWLCGGSIIDANWILTAGHCTNGATSVEVLAGAHNRLLSEPTQATYTSSIIITHEDYSRLFIRNDLGLIEITEGITFTPEIQPVCLPARGSADITTGDTAIATGWGKLADDGTTSAVLMQATMPVISYDACEVVYGLANSEEVVCTDTTGSIGTCNGDSGGPLNHDEFGDGTYCTRGITSFVSGSGCEAQQPDAFTRVSHYLDWISTKTGLIIP